MPPPDGGCVASALGAALDRPVDLDPHPIRPGLDRRPRPECQRFFATEIDTCAQPPGINAAGRPYHGLLDDRAAAPTLTGPDPGDAAQLAPEAPGGLNIEDWRQCPTAALLVGR